MIKLKKNKLLLLKGIIDSDFLILNKNVNYNSRSLTSRLNLNGIKVNYSDSLETIKTLKQFIRLLQHSQLESKNLIHLVLKNKQFVKIRAIM